GAPALAGELAAPRHRAGVAVAEARGAPRRRGPARRRVELSRHPARVRRRPARRAVDPRRLDRRLRSAPRAAEALVGGAPLPGKARRLDERPLRFPRPAFLPRPALRLRQLVSPLPLRRFPPPRKPPAKPRRKD